MNILGLWLSIFLVVSVTEGQLQFDKFQTEPGIYFSEIGKSVVSTSEWKFIIYFNLSEYWHEWRYLEQTFAQLQLRCENKSNGSNYIQNCKELLEPISHLVNQVEDNNELFKPHASRVRRAPLDFVGNIFGDLFGVLNQRDAQMYSEQIEGLATGTIKMQKFIQQQTKVLDLTSNIIRKEHEQIQKQYSWMQKEIQTILMHEEFLDAVFQLSTAVFIYKDIQGDLIDMLSDVHHGRASTRVLPPSTFAKQLGEVAQFLSRDERVPSFEAHWIEVYKLLETKAAIIKEQIICEVRIPLVQGEEFQIYNIIPLPVRHEGSFIYIEPQFRYALVNRDRTWYYPTSAQELHECKYWERDTVICRIEGPMYKVASSEQHCEMSLLTHAEKPPEQCQVRAMPLTTFVHSLRNNRWLLVLSKGTTFDLTCDQQTQSVKLQGAGIITLSSDCSLRGPSTLFKAKISYNTSIYSDIIPKFNLSQETKSPIAVFESEDIGAELSDLQQSVTELKREEIWNQVDLHHVGNYTATSITVILIIILMRWLYKHKKQQKNLEIRLTKKIPRVRERVLDDNIGNII